MATGGRERTGAGDRGAVSLKRHALFIAGTICLIVGVIGAFVPILPTTPFLLLAAACYLRSSPRAHHWLVNSRFPGVYIRHYQSGRGLPLGMRLGSIALLWLTIGYSAIYVVENAWIRALLALIAIGVTVHIASIRPHAPAEGDGTGA